ncbi:MAG TPA: DoxX family protein [Candidatus Angelobacter sp.]
MKFLSKFESQAYLLLRLVFGFLFACHGAQKMFGILGGHRIPPGLNLDFLGTLIELICGALILLGLFTRPAAFIASGEMAVAYFMVHAKAHPIPLVNGGELAVIYCFVALFIASHGAGRFGFDRS